MRTEWWPVWLQAINVLHTAAKQMGNAVEQGGDD